MSLRAQEFNGLMAWGMKLNLSLVVRDRCGEASDWGQNNLDLIFVAKTVNFDSFAHRCKGNPHKYFAFNLDELWHVNSHRLPVAHHLDSADPQRIEESERPVEEDNTILAMLHYPLLYNPALLEYKRFHKRNIVCRDRSWWCKYISWINSELFIQENKC